MIAFLHPQSTWTLPMLDRESRLNPVQQKLSLAFWTEIQQSL